MHCFVCRQPCRTHILRAVGSGESLPGWARICVPCAIKHDIDGVLFNGKRNVRLARQWEHYRRRKDQASGS